MEALSPHHVGITVSDLEHMVAFYRDVLGCTVVDRFSVSGDALSRATGVSNASADFVHLDMNDTRIELVTYGSDTVDSSARSLDRPGTPHIAFSVDDVTDFLSTVPGEITPLSEPQTTASGSTIVFFRDPEGNLVELLER